MRSKLVKIWGSCDLNQINVDMVRYFKFRGMEGCLENKVLRTNASQTYLEMDPVFQTKMLDLSNYQLEPVFFQRHPYLAYDTVENGRRASRSFE
jgi:hypothetical protein